MRRRVSRRTLACGGLALALAVAVGVSLAPNLRGDPAGASPATLRRIAQKNDRAAMEAGARMRAKSEASAEAADALLAAEERGRSQADATLARFDNQEGGRAGRAAAPTADQ
jgi:hypothetical protein